jgi:hypothetical protein
LTRSRAKSAIRKQKHPYTSGELNKLTDAVVHPLFKLDPYFVVLDAVVHVIIERNPSESLVKFIKYSIPKLLVSQKRSKPK